MKQAEIHSLLSLPCYRIVEEECVFGTLECQENQVRFVQKNRIFSISFYKIENIELRTIDDHPQIVFLTHVGLIVFYFYEETPTSHISYIHNAILGAFLAYTNRSFARPIWSGYCLQQAPQKASVHVCVYNSKITIQQEETLHTFTKESVQHWHFKKRTLSIQSGHLHFVLHGTHLSLLYDFTQAILDGGILGFWKNTPSLRMKEEILLLSKKHLYTSSHSWLSSHTNKLNVEYIHSITHTAKGIVFSSLIHPTYTFSISSHQSHIFMILCSKISQLEHSEDVFLWRAQSFYRGTLSETKDELIIQTHRKIFRWPWASLCRDDDENSHSNTVSLRNNKGAIRIHIPSTSFSIKDFYMKHMLPHRRIEWNELSEGAKQRIFTSRYVFVRSETSVFQIVAQLDRLRDHFQLTTISAFSPVSKEQQVFVHFHTQHGQYSFLSTMTQKEENLILSFPTTISLTSQRHSPRYRTEKKAMCSLLSLDHSTNRWSSKNNIFSAQLVNISEGGACIVTPMEFSKSQRILLDIEDYPQQIICTVRYCIQHHAGEYRIGLQFYSVSNQIRKNINDMLKIFVKEKH